MTGNLHEDPCTFMTIYHWIIFRMRNVGEKVLEKIKTHILCSLNLIKIRAVYELMWQTFVEPDRLHMTVK
jgi:hypothetical protein